MKRVPILLCLSLFASAAIRAQQTAPPPPIGPKGSVKPTEPPQTVVPVPVAPQRPNGKVKKSLVRRTTTAVEPDYKAPWNSGAIGRGIGAGFVIEGSRILTNAHVISNSRYLTVERDGDPNKYPAKVQFVAHDCDLALITVDAPEFYKTMIPLQFGGIPELES